MTFMRKLFYFPLCCLFFTGCAIFDPIIQKPSIQLHDMKMTDINLFTATPIFTIKVTNPNPIGIPVQNVSYRLDINNNQFAEGKNPIRLNVGAKESSLINIPITINYLKCFDTIQELIHSKSMDYHFQGAIQTGLITLPYQYRGKFSLPDFPKIELKQIRMENLSFSGASVTIDLLVENRNSFPVNLNGLSYALSLNGNKILNGTQKNPLTLEKAKTANLSLPLQMNFITMGDALMFILRQPSTSYKIDGVMAFSVPDMGIKEIPFSKEGTVPINQ